VSRPIFGLNVNDPHSHSLVKRAPARVAFFSLASDFGCQVHLTDDEDHLIDLLGMFELVSWPMVVTAPEPEAYDIAIVEGAVTEEAHRELLEKVRATAEVVIALGACAATAGIPALVGGDVEGAVSLVYGESAQQAAGLIVPRPVSSVIAVDYVVPGCPADPAEVVSTIQRALLGMQPLPERPTLCGTCRLHENGCFLARGQVCLGMVANDGCDARCIVQGRPCVACRGIAPSANLASARCSVEEHDLDGTRFDEALRIFNASVFEDGPEEGRSA